MRRYFIAMHDSNLGAEQIDEAPRTVSVNITHQMCYASSMRTTIDIADDVFLTIKEIALQQKTSAGSVVSKLLRDALQPKASKRKYRNGVPLLPARPGGPVVTSTLVNRLRDEDQ
jgi:Arc/MetJ family transcription regulator